MEKGKYDPKEHAEYIYNMDLHECLSFSDELYVTRVPGGWIYDRAMRGEDHSQIGFLQSMFVPFNTEFREISIEDS
jgi:hypothetical protein